MPGSCRFPGRGGNCRRERDRTLRCGRVKSLKTQRAACHFSFAGCTKLVTGVLGGANPVRLQAGDLKTERYSRLLLDFREPIPFA